MVDIGRQAKPHPAGRWPANVVLSHTPECREVGTRKVRGGVASPRSPGQFAGAVYGDGREGSFPGSYAGPDGTETIPAWECAPECPVRLLDEQAGSPRFFYTAKASSAERDGSKHPTVKPLALMRWLVRLVTPPGGTVLDPFAGSGTTLLAAREEGFRAIGIEREAEYLADAARRLRQLSLLSGAE